MAKVIERDGWAVNDRWQGEIQGTGLGVGFSLIFNDFEEVGRGPRLHTHPYSETFIIQTGRALFVIGDQQHEAVAGQILICPPGLPHKYTNLGPGLLEAVNIHANGTSIIKWLE